MHHLDSSIYFYIPFPTVNLLQCEHAKKHFYLNLVKKKGIWPSSFARYSKYLNKFEWTA